MPDKRATEENIFSWSSTDIEKEEFERKWERDSAVKVLVRIYAVVPTGDELCRVRVELPQWGCIQDRICGHLGCELVGWCMRQNAPLSLLGVL